MLHKKTSHTYREKEREIEREERATRILWLQTQKHHRFSSINDKVRILPVTLKVFTHYNKLVWTKVWSHAPLLIYILLHLVPYFYCIIYNKKSKWTVKYLPYCFLRIKGLKMWYCLLQKKTLKFTFIVKNELELNSVLFCHALKHHCFIPLSISYLHHLNIHTHIESFKYCRQTFNFKLAAKCVILKYFRHDWIVFIIFSPFPILPILHIPYVPKILQSFKRATSNLSRSLFS